MTEFALRQLKAQAVNEDNFYPFGQAIFACEDGAPYSDRDAQLHLQGGIPRFYIMRLLDRGRKFHRLTRHAQCTQCLGALDSKDWLIAVAPPSAGGVPQVDPETINAFRIPGNCFIKLNCGTWHAGPYFEYEFVDFYNLELSDTNINDHFTCDLAIAHGLAFEII
jgi:hypothetical protein